MVGGRVQQPPRTHLWLPHTRPFSDQHGYAVYFSRGVIPHNKDGAVR